ncbi:MAG: ROK family protein [Clostridiales bacterium]|nr:ROK family protein [Clostridiales bacterium]
MRMFLLGIDIGGTNIKIGFIEKETGVLVAFDQLPFQKELGYRKICERIRDKAFELAQEKGIDIDEVSSVGAAVPGSIDPEEKTVLNAYNLDFKNVPLKEELSTLFTGKSVSIVNDASAAAFAEFKAGALKGHSTAVFLTIGTGLGGCLVLGGKLFNGGRGYGVEPGHIIIDCYGEKCTCGNVGCAETLCSASWLARQGRSALISYPDSLIAQRSGNDPERVSAKLVIDAVRSGDTAAIRIFNEFLENLSSAIASMVNLLDPEIIAIGGGISAAGDILYIPLELKVNDKAFFKDEYKVVPAVMGNDAGMIGAALLAAEKAGDR